jgi:superfamily II DNA or RNA helicase
VQNTLRQYGRRRRLSDEGRLFGDRKAFTEVVELTSRVTTDKVKEARARLETPYSEPRRLDCAIATNMISVGLDVPRLGLMVVFGQPKTTSEYIQATSRVGRSDKRPGLVVTLLNIHRPRDRSHYERFRGYHQSFYRSVEVASVTPFSARALDRGMAGALVTFARHAAAKLSPALGAKEIEAVRAEIEDRLLQCFDDRLQRQPFIDEDEREERRRSVQNRIVDLLDAWRSIVAGNARDGVRTQYQDYEPDSMSNVPHLLREMLEREIPDEAERKFRVNRSMRDVEPTVNLFLADLPSRSWTGGREA